MGKKLLYLLVALILVLYSFNAGAPAYAVTNTGWQKVSNSIANTAPLAMLEKISPDNNPLPAFRWSPGDGTSYEVRIDSGNWTNIGGNLTYVQPSVLSKGFYNFHVRVKDGLGNITNESAMSFKVVAEADLSNTRLAFTKYLEGNNDIYTIKQDGSGQTRITTNSAEDIDPNWSPDGTKITFTSLRDGNHDIYVMNTNGIGQTRLTTNSVWDNHPAWSPDGSKIAFTSGRDGNAEIYMMNADGSNQVRLTTNPALDDYPDWSPDGKKIVFTSGRDGDWQIYVMNADGTEQMRLTSNSYTDFDPVWSPDGGKIAFASRRDGNIDIYTMNTDGTAQIRLTTSFSDDSRPAWSPDGSKIAYVSWNGEKADIYVMNANGSSETSLTANVMEEQFDWSPFQPDPAGILNAIMVTPSTPTIGSGQIRQFTAIGTYTDNSTVDITTSVSWSSSNSTVVTINSAGMATALAAGTTVITATSVNISSNVTLTVTPAEETTVDITVTLQGGHRPDSGYIIPLTINFFTPGADVMSDMPLFSFTSNTTRVGTTANATANVSIPSGTYEITVKSEHTLTNVNRNVNITSPSTAIDMGTLLEGNAREDTPTNAGIINIYDYGALLSSWNKIVGDTGFNSNADFDRNGIIDIHDFGLLSSNWIKTSPVALPFTLPDASPPLARLVLLPNSQSVRVNDSFDVAIQLQSNGEAISGVAAYLDFDPAYLAVNSITWAVKWDGIFTALNEKTFDNTTGTINFAAGIFGTAVTGNISLATINFQAKALTSNTSIAFHFGPPATRVTEIDDTGDSALNQAIGADITIIELISISVTPGNPLIPAGSAAQFTATGIYNDGSTENITGNVTWTSSNTSVASINSSGLASALFMGTTSITATSGNVSGSTLLTVTIPSGDANGDGVVNALDITKIERIILGLDTATSGADANQDGNINAIDVTKVERIIAGLP